MCAARIPGCLPAGPAGGGDLAAGAEPDAQAVEVLASGRGRSRQAGTSGWPSGDVVGQSERAGGTDTAVRGICVRHRIGRALVHEQVGAEHDPPGLLFRVQSIEMTVFVPVAIGPIMSGPPVHARTRERYRMQIVKQSDCR